MMRSFLKSFKVLKFQIISSYSQKMNFDTLLLCLYTLSDDFIYHIECKCETIESI